MEFINLKSKAKNTNMFKRYFIKFNVDRSTLGQLKENGDFPGNSVGFML